MEKETLRIAKIAFREAECFLLASKYIDDGDKASPYVDIYKYAGMGTAMFVNHALSVELYLKCLQILTGTYNPNQKTHFLGTLFGELPESIKQKLNDRYANHYAKSDIDIFDKKQYTLGQLLTKTGDFFVQARYDFSRNSFGNVPRNRLIVGLDAIKDIIFEICPDLKDIEFK